MNTIRKATHEDIVIGNELVHVCDDEELKIMKIVDVLAPHDPYKAFVEEDGCRYGLEGSWIFEEVIIRRRDPTQEQIKESVALEPKTEVEE